MADTPSLWVCAEEQGLDPRVHFPGLRPHTRVLWDDYGVLVEFLSNSSRTHPILQALSRVFLGSMEKSGREHFDLIYGVTGESDIFSMQARCTDQDVSGS